MSCIFPYEPCLHNYLNIQINFVGQRIPQGPQAVGHQVIQLAVLEGRQVLLEIGPSRLGPGTDGHRPAVKVVGRRTGLVDVWPLVLELWDICDYENLLPSV